MHRALVVVFLVVVAGCDSGDDAPDVEPGALISGELTLERDGEPFSVMYGSMLDYEGGLGILSFADAPQCFGSGDDVTYFISASLGTDFDGNRDYDVGAMFGFNDLGIVVDYTGGQLHLTEVNATVVSGSLAWGGPDMTGEHTYTLTGTFEVGRCPGH